MFTGAFSGTVLGAFADTGDDGILGGADSYGADRTSHDRLSPSELLDLYLFGDQSSGIGVESEDRDDRKRDEERRREEDAEDRREDALKRKWLENFKKDGYFVEFGSCNGVEFSNTLMLEREFGWKGILAEPARCWHYELKKNRDCNIETNCVWKETGVKLIFKESELALYSSIKNLSDNDLHKNLREKGTTYEVETISLNDLLEKYKAPKEIDYLSVDTEGSEFEILQNFDFNKYNIKIITCEHNFTSLRSKIFNLLTQKGYKRFHKDLSKHDDWYIKI